ncbi:hypothetical protein EJP82_01155 [Paenibacillus anaericanus]|uniref:FtsK domain-containing protein n=1 Tax=Paenibacillus anaericanus TaxID=170367 RepID=A0A433YFB8_9BACL|nr:FtsK/SpoIIIE domain-containing protein [Paenibacillus anaericanus]RUT48578.1 hypothetical protein EJP82_01155 [Paenibacillus anaericanus]
MIMSGVTMAGAAQLLKLAGAGGCSLAAWGVWRGLPDQVVRRKLMDLFRIGGMYYRFQGYKGRELRNYPLIRRVTVYINRTEAAFRLPTGLDPQEVMKKAWLFRQVFGATAELEQGEDAATFVMCIYRTSMESYEYDAERIGECVKGIGLPVYVGRTRSGDVLYDMVEHPHLLLAGETGSGKSVALRSILTTLIRSCGDSLELYCADMKRSEFHIFRDVAQDVVMDAAGLHKIVLKLRREMKKRGDLLDHHEVAHVDDLPKWDKPAYIVLAVDEVALLKKEKDIMDGIEEISTIGRALGVFLILSMQRPDADILDGKLKNNLTVRMAFRHADEINSRITIGSGEAAAIKQSEKGRMVLKLNGCQYVQGPHISIEDARMLLEPFKRHSDINTLDVPRTTAYEPQDDNSIELGVL